MFRTEYPRPDFIRKQWASLNGLWEYEESSGKTAEYYFDTALCGAVEVPFAAGAPLSRVREGFRDVWYKKNFFISKERLNGSVILNWVSVNDAAAVYLNRRPLYIHKSASPLRLDITQFLTEGNNTLVLNIVGDGETVGIAGSVWLEFTSKSYISNLRLNTFIKQASIVVQGQLSGFTDGYLNVIISYGDKIIADYKYRAEKNFILSAALKATPVLWRVLNGCLYNVEVVYLSADGVPLDSVKSYCAFREIELKDGRLLVNGAGVFLKCLEDSRYYTGGKGVAPYADNIKQDIRLSVALGFNAVYSERPFEPLYRYYADKLGLILIASVNSPDENEIMNTVFDNIGNPCVLIWYPKFTVTEKIYNLIKSLDPSRPIAAKGASFKADVIIYDRDDGDIVYRVKEGITETFASEKEEKRFRKQHPDALYGRSAAALPSIVSFGGHELSRMSTRDERNFLSSYERIKDTVETVNSAGFIYRSLADDDKSAAGLADVNRDIKLSRESQNLLFLINSK